MQRYPAGRRAVAAVLNDARKSVGLSQRKLSERLGRLDKYGHMIESAQQGISAEEFMAWAWACETSGSALMRCAEQLLKAQGQPRAIVVRSLSLASPVETEDEPTLDESAELATRMAK